MQQAIHSHADNIFLSAGKNLLVDSIDEPDTDTLGGRVAYLRGLDCNPYLASIQMGEQARQQQISNGLWMMQMARPQPMATPAVSPSVICTTRPGPSGTTSTVCQ